MIKQLGGMHLELSAGQSYLWEPLCALGRVLVPVRTPSPILEPGLAPAQKLCLLKAGVYESVKMETSSEHNALELLILSM